MPDGSFEPIPTHGGGEPDIAITAMSIQDELIRYIQHDVPRSAWAATVEGMNWRNRLLDKIRELTYPEMPMVRCDRIAAFGKPDPVEASR